MAAEKLVGELMTRSVTTLDHDAKLLDAALLMRSSGYRHLPIVQEGQLVGMLSDRDVQRASPSIFSDISPDEYNRIFEVTPVSKVMAREPVTVTPETPLKEAVRIIHEHKFGALPVVAEDKRLVGIISITDMLGVLNSLLSES